MATSPARCTWVKVWVDFWWLLEGFPYTSASTYEDVWAFLNTAKGSAIQRLDRQIRAANDDGNYAIITLYQALPDWVIGPVNGPNVGKPFTQAYPNALPGQPWSWLISYLNARYKYGAGYNPTGPGRSGENQWGNPYYAWAYMIEFTNEPNTLCWPQNFDKANGFECQVATMFKTAEECSYFWAGTGAPFVLGPGVLDWQGANNDSTVSWDVFTQRVCQTLNGWQPRKYVGWSLHNYRDVLNNDGGQQARRAIQILGENAWKLGTDATVFITEAGLNMGAGTSFYEAGRADASDAGEATQRQAN
jgi:hypothetical protein